jgi:hypothetical protein
VVQGFSQRKGIVFDKTYSPTCRLQVLRAMLSEASGDRTIFTAQWDMYINQAPGFKDGSQRVCELLKCLYGTKQAPLLFYHTVRDSLLAFGAVQSKCDECLFIVRWGNAWVKLLVHVDDFAITYKDAADGKLLLYADLLRHMEGIFISSTFWACVWTSYPTVPLRWTSALILTRFWTGWVCTLLLLLPPLWPVARSQSYINWTGL